MDESKARVQEAIDTGEAHVQEGIDGYKAQIVVATAKKMSVNCNTRNCKNKTNI